MFFNGDMGYNSIGKIADRPLGHPFYYLDLHEKLKECDEFIDNLETISNNYGGLYCDFLHDVNEKIKNSFDANTGTCWDDIESAIKDTINEILDQTKEAKNAN